MFKLAKCTVIFNLKVKSQCCLTVCGYHTSQLLSSNNAYYSNCTNQQKPKYQSVAHYYAGKSVFLTGGTGFLGKVFIEKLLSNCSQLDKIYVLIRGRKGAPPEHRLQKLLQAPVFTKLRNENPEYLSKVVAIAGDITEPKLGIKPADEQLLIDKVSVVFHSAATVKFTDTFKDVININVEGTRRVLNLSQQMKNIEIFIHISTAFSNSDKIIVDEIVYPPPKKFEDVEYFVKNHANDQKKIEKYTKGHANVYTFSKGLAESLVFENHGNTPAIIVRPSVVSPVLKEPMPGWIDSWVANTALFSDTARGLTRIFYGTEKTVLDMIPVDYVCNLTIAAAAKAPKSKEVTVYNSCSSSTNPITWKGATDMFVQESVNFGYRELPCPKVFVSESALVVSAVTFVSQIIPFTADLWLRVTGRKPKYMAAQAQANLLRDLIKNFTSGSFLAKTDRVEELMSSLDENDRKQFQFDPKTIDWKNYVSLHCFGVKQYLLSNKTK